MRANRSQYSLFGTATQSERSLPFYGYPGICPPFWLLLRVQMRPAPLRHLSALHYPASPYGPGPFLGISLLETFKPLPLPRFQEGLGLLLTSTKDTSKTGMREATDRHKRPTSIPSSRRRMAKTAALRPQPISAAPLRDLGSDAPRFPARPLSRPLFCLICGSGPGLVRRSADP